MRQPQFFQSHGTTGNPVCEFGPGVFLVNSKFFGAVSNFIRGFYCTLKKEPRDCFLSQLLIFFLGIHYGSSGLNLRPALSKTFDEYVEGIFYIVKQ